jgi:hypothetical protein
VHGVKRAIKEEGEEGGAAAEPEDVSSHPPEEMPPPTPVEVKPPPPEEVKQLKPPRHKVARQPVVPLRAPKVNVEDACFSV